jgi:hypothetical protein
MSGQVHAPVTLPPREIAHCIHWIGGWVGPRASLDVMEKTKIFSMLGIEPWLSSPKPIATPTELFLLLLYPDNKG